MYQHILDFWFQEIDQSLWWRKDSDFDALIEHRFLSVHTQAAQGELESWRGSAAGSLAEIIVLDQFSRNIFRDSPRAFAYDAMALTLAQFAINKGFHAQLLPEQCGFMLLPFMHSESPKIHRHALALYEQYGSEANLSFERQHKAIIDRFGRYPHRNAILGRPSTEEEVLFLKQPGSSF